MELNPPLPDPAKLIAKIANALNLGEKTTRDAVRILTAIKDHNGTAGKDPMGLAGTVLYLACTQNSENVGQKELANAAGVTEVTIRNRTKEVRMKYEHLF